MKNLVLKINGMHCHRCAVIVQEIEAVGLIEKELLDIAGAVESFSVHPLGQAVVNTAFERDVQIPAVDNFEADIGIAMGSGTDIAIESADIIN